MAYKVIQTFRDKEDNNSLCRSGEIYPREGLSPTKERLKTLIDAGYIAEDKKKGDKVESIDDTPKKKTKTKE